LPPKGAHNGNIYIERAIYSPLGKLIFL